MAEKTNEKMFFYRLDESGTEIIKYIVEVDKEKILKLRSRMIDRCSVITPDKTFIGPALPENIKAKARNIMRGDSIPEEDHDLRLYRPEKEIQYRWTYDEYEYPSLVGIVDRLLEGDPTVLPFLKGEKPRVPKKDFDEEIAAMRNACAMLDDADPRKIDKLREFQTLLRKVRVNEGQKAPMHYFDAVAHEIKLVFWYKIPLEDVKKVLDFTGGKLEDLGIYGISFTEDDPIKGPKQH